MRLVLAVGSNSRLKTNSTPNLGFSPSSNVDFEDAIPDIASFELTGSGVAGDPHTPVITFTTRPWPSPTRSIVYKRDGVAFFTTSSLSSFTPTDTYALTATITVTNSLGTDEETSVAVNLKPGYTELPTISTDSGFYHVGDTATANPPATIGQVLSMTYTWKRDGIQIATGNSYTFTEDDVEKQITVEANITGTYGTTVAVAEPVFIRSVLPTVTITDITDTGFTDLTIYTATFNTTGAIVQTDIEWYAVDDPNIILATGNNVTFPDPVEVLKAKVTVRTVDGFSAFDVSDDSAVVLESVAPVVNSATIDLGGQQVNPGTPLNAIIDFSGSPQPSITSIQWKEAGVNISGATSTLFTEWTDVTGTITYSYTVSNGIDPDVSGNSSDSVTVAVDNSPTLSGTPDFNLTSTDPDETEDLTVYGTNLLNGVWSLTLDKVVSTETINFDTTGYVFIDYKYLFVGATQWTATGTAQVTNPFSGTPAALPTGFANSEQSGVLRIADTVTDGSYDVKFWAGNGTSSTSVTATIVRGEAGSATAPPAPPEANWELNDVGDGRLAIVVISPFPDGGSTNTDRQYEVDDSDSWVSFGVTGSGTFYIPADELTVDQQASVKLRSINAIGTGAESVAKTATPTSPSTFTLTISDDYATWTGTSGLASLSESDNYAIWSAT